MDQLSPNPPILPQSPNPPVYGPVLSDDAPAPHRFVVPHPYLLIGSVVVVLIAGSILFASAGHTVAPAATVAPTPTETPTPTPMRTRTSFATGSAFLTFEKSTAALPDAIQNAVLTDQTLAPPVLDLPLGFSNE
jgi:hypothetical protein